MILFSLKVIVSDAVRGSTPDSIGSSGSRQVSSGFDTTGQQPQPQLQSQQQSLPPPPPQPTNFQQPPPASSQQPPQQQIPTSQGYQPPDQQLAAQPYPQQQGTLHFKLENVLRWSTNSDTNLTVVCRHRWSR